MEQINSMISKDIKVGDTVAIVYNNSIAIGFQAGKLGQFWEYWAIKRAYDNFKNGTKKAFKPRTSYITSNTDRRVIKINFDEIDPTHKAYKELKESRDMLKELNVIK